jgi:PGF-CTERM protein
MQRTTVAAVLVLAVALVAATVVPVTAQVQSTDEPRTQQSTTRLSEPQPDEELANGTGGKVARGRENDEDQQFPGKTTFKIDDHTPGASSNSFNIYAEGFSENIRMHWNVVQQEDFDFSSCTSTSATAFGIDRGNDDPGTKTDESLLDAYKSVTYTKHNIYVEFYKESRLAGGPKNITVDDQIVSRVTNCLVNPSDPGWYRLTGYINGSTKMDTQTDYAIYGAARFVYVCEGCDSRQAAIDELGPPPTTCPKTNEFDQDTREWTCRTDDGTYYTNSDKPGDDGSSSRSTSTPTPGGGGTVTATPAATATATAAPATTPTDTSSTGDSTATQRRQQDEPSGTAQPTATAQASATATSGSARQAASQPTGTGPTTPTLANGPGFGSVLAVVALLAAALAVVRRE